ncbi:MAG: sulfite exporter TauE/SafE family protein [Oligoflexia bacterium]|nr:sulfite exporter TauE/SafE family protein [Oligoflexia bacterium]
MTNSLAVVYFPAAVALGALHALEPGHAKALTAAYLIGIKGTKRDSVILGLSVAATHSIVVIGISAVGLWLGNEAFTGQAIEWLERSSGIVAVSIGSWMLWRRLALRSKSHDRHHHHHAPDPVVIAGHSVKGRIEIVDTPLGERMRFMGSHGILDDELAVEIDREDSQVERLILEKSHEGKNVYLSTTIPDEPHKFSARFIASKSGEVIPFSMKEPEGHHDHTQMDDIAHARAHAATLPSYVRTGTKPSVGQIIGFGAAGGMIPCPASITVMLWALSTGKAGLGVFTVLGFSVGLAVALVGIGVIVVSGLSRLSVSGRFTAISSQAPVISAGLVIVSGLFALVIAH